MPEMNGFELVKALRSKDDDLPVLLMTGDPSLDGAVRAIDYGAVSYIAKPFDHEALASQVARAARRHGVQRMRRRAESWARDIYGDTKVFRNTEETTFYATDLFACKDNHHWDCVPPVIYHPGETVVRR